MKQCENMKGKRMFNGYKIEVKFTLVNAPKEDLLTIK